MPAMQQWDFETICGNFNVLVAASAEKVLQSLMASSLFSLVVSSPCCCDGVVVPVVVANAPLSIISHVCVCVHPPIVTTADLHASFAS